MPHLEDFDALVSAEQHPRSGLCKYLRVIEDLTDDQRDKLDGLSAPSVARVLTGVGRKISDKAVRDHRTGAHNCG